LRHISISFIPGHNTDNETKPMKSSRLIILTSLSVFLLSCSTAVKESTDIKVTNQVQQQVQEEKESTDYYLKQAQLSYQRSGDLSLRNQWLLRAAEALNQQQHCQQSIKFVQAIYPQLLDNMQQTQAKLILAECYLALQEPAYTEAQLLLPQLATQIGFDQRISALEAQLLVHQQRYVEAAKAWLASNLSAQQQSQQIWQTLQNLSLAQLEQARLREPQLQAWVQLSLIVRRFGQQPELLDVAVKEWQLRFSDNALALSLPEEIVQALVTQPLKAKKIAILLPLTGRLAQQGQALKQGILAAYFDDKQAGSEDNLQSPAQLSFFDSALKTPEELNTMVVDHDLIIGPLLKEQIAPLIPLLAVDKTLLALNRIDQQDTMPGMAESYFYALAPEDEAEQLAVHLKSQGFVQPVLVAAESEATRRMAEAFVNKWQSLSDPYQYVAPAQASFNDSKSIGSSVANILDVAQSKNRIRQINNLTIGELHDVPRSRQDIDAIVVFANPEQTELLNPIIEASLSPFADPVPVFASSRSYSLELSKNSLRDLRNLTFTDMPWMLPDNPWPQLAAQSNLLWPQRRDNLLRLFAMGYDAYKLIPNLRHLHLLPHNSTFGLTGTLAVTSQGNVVRQLPWGKVNEDKVSLLGGD
jgi:outer membrane PBP1 activator LpoA protein